MIAQSWRDILELAQRAPSPHNVQPWKVRITSLGSCTVYIDGARTLPEEDTTGSFITSGMVMYLETMRYAAQTYQYDLSYEILPDQPVDQAGLQLFANVSLRADATIVPDFDRQTILSRRTSRLSYTADTVSTDDQAALQQLATTYGYTYGFSSDSNLIEQILKQNITALFHDFNSPSYHDEIVSWFRFSNRSSQAHKDGLDFRCMQIPSAEYYLAARFPFILKLPLLQAIFAKRYRRHLGTTPTIAWVSGPFWNPQDSVNAGKFLVRFWLELTRRGLYLHPLGNLVTNLPARATFESMTASKDVWFVIRIGNSQEPPESYRRPVEDILIGEPA